MRGCGYRCVCLCACVCVYECVCMCSRMSRGCSGSRLADVRKLWMRWVWPCRDTCFPSRPANPETTYRMVDEGPLHTGFMSQRHATGFPSLEAMCGSVQPMSRHGVRPQPGAGK